ncbi:MAG: phenylalanine--tRNA ligase beta subunit-related protein [Nitrososphaerota archaeon]
MIRPMDVEEVCISVEQSLAESFPGLSALGFRLDGLELSRGDSRLERLVGEVVNEIRRSYNLETLKDVPIFRAYRDFFWRIGIDPTKMRPSSEALVRRILLGREFPRINPLVDIYNLASAKTGVTMASYDSSKVRGGLSLTWSRAGERFRGIGMDREIILQGREVVLRDESSILSIYPYRDSDHSKTESQTKSAIVIVCGVPGIEASTLEQAKETVLRYVALALER